MALTFRPADCRAVIADSRPEPGPFTRTSISFRPNLVALSAAVSAARCAANGVLLRLPLNPTVPADAKHSVSPLVSLIVTMVLLKVALMWATPRLTLRRALRFLLFAIIHVVSCQWTVVSKQRRSATHWLQSCFTDHWPLPTDHYFSSRGVP